MLRQLDRGGAGCHRLGTEGSHPPGCVKLHLPRASSEENGTSSARKATALILVKSALTPTHCPVRPATRRLRLTSRSFTLRAARGRRGSSVRAVAPLSTLQRAPACVGWAPTLGPRVSVWSRQGTVYRYCTVPVCTIARP